MTIGTKVKLLWVSSLLMVCAVGFAQGMAARGAGRAQGQSRVTSGSRLQDRDRLSTHSMDRLHDRTHDRTQDRLHDRIHDADRLRDRDQDRIYGATLMSATERTQYEERLHSLPTEQERVQFRMDHQHDMRQRAAQRGVSLSPAPTEAQIKAQERQRQGERERIYGYSMMTPAEVGRYEQQMRSARSEKERTRIDAEHRRLMQERARERGEAAPK